MTPVSDQSRIVASARPRPKMFALALVFAVVLLGIGFVVWVMIKPSKPAGDASAVSAAFLGYTNNGAGKRVAMFSITNRSPIAIRRQWYYEVQVLTNGTWKPQPTVHLPLDHGPIIAPNQSEIWTIDAPAAEGRWRTWFPFVEYHGPVREMKKWIRRELRGLGLPFKDSEATYMGLTEEVEAEGVESR